MDDELRMLGAVLAAPEPSTETIDASRDRLRTTMLGTARRRRAARPPLIAGLGLTAAAATAAVAVLAAQPGERAGTPGGPGGTPSTPRQSARQFLLAAADTVAAEPARSGTYWHIKMVHSDAGDRAQGRYHPQELYIRRDGQKWAVITGGVIKLPSGALPLFYKTDLTFPEIQTLPTEPGALTKDLLGRMTRSRKAELRRGGAEFRDEVTCETLVTLLELPAPPKVRAAAFRALAALPDVRHLGRADGGTALVYAPRGVWRVKWVVDPKTFLVRTEERDRSAKYGWPMFKVDIPVAEWTNRLPPVIVPEKRPHRPPAGRP